MVSLKHIHKNACICLSETHAQERLYMSLWNTCTRTLVYVFLKERHIQALLCMCFRETYTSVLVYVLQRETYRIHRYIDLFKDALSKINVVRIANIVLLRMPLTKSIFFVYQALFVKDAFSKINVFVFQTLF
jgi:hypothetical protein